MKTIVVDIPDHLMDEVMRLHKEMNDHIKGGDQTVEQTLARLLAIAIEEWDQEKD